MVPVTQEIVLAGDTWPFLLCARSSWKLRSCEDMGLNISSVLTVDIKVTKWLHYAGGKPLTASCCLHPLSELNEVPFTKFIQFFLPFLERSARFSFRWFAKIVLPVALRTPRQNRSTPPRMPCKFCSKVVLSDSQLFCPVVHVVTTQCVVYFVSHSRHSVTPILIWSANPTHHWSQHFFLYNVQTGQLGLCQWHSEEADENRRGDDWIKQPQAQLDGDVFVCKEALETNVPTFRQVTCVLATQIFGRSTGGQYIQCFTIDADKLRNTVGTGCQKFRFGLVQVQTHLCQFFT